MRANIPGGCPEPSWYISADRSCQQKYKKGANMSEHWYDNPGPIFLHFYLWSNEQKNEWKIKETGYFPEEKKDSEKVPFL